MVMSYLLKSSQFGKLMFQPSDGPSVSINDRAWRIADFLPASTPLARNQALKSSARQSPSTSMAVVIFHKTKEKRIKGPVVL